MRGRPTKLDPQVASRIVDLVRAGNYIDTAAGTCNIHRSTLYRWLQKGEQQRSGPFRDFHDAVVKAQAESESRDLLLIAKAAVDDWRAAAWRLERRSPRRYGPQVQLTVRQELEDMLEYLEQQLDPMAYAQVLRALSEGSKTEEELP